MFPNGYGIVWDEDETEESHIEVPRHARNLFSVAECYCGWVGNPTVDPHKSWQGHYRRVTR